MGNQKNKEEKPLPPEVSTMHDLADLLGEDDDELYARKRDRYLANLEKNLIKEQKIPNPDN